MIADRKLSRVSFSSFRIRVPSRELSSKSRRRLVESGSSVDSFLIITSAGSETFVFDERIGGRSGSVDVIDDDVERDNDDVTTTGHRN